MHIYGYPIPFLHPYPEPSDSVLCSLQSARCTLHAATCVMYHGPHEAVNKIIAFVKSEKGMFALKGMSFSLPLTKLDLIQAIKSRPDPLTLTFSCSRSALHSTFLWPRLLYTRHVVTYVSTHALSLNLMLQLSAFPNLLN